MIKAAINQKKYQVATEFIEVRKDLLPIMEQYQSLLDELNVIKAKERESKRLEIKQEKPEVEKPIININNKNIIKKEKKVNKKPNVDKKNIKVAITAVVVSAITTLGLTYIITKKKNKRD